ncbi:MAG: endonuclease/exonuclease/phosphatase family protein, partial [Rubripirellula sp.]
MGKLFGRKRRSRPKSVSTNIPFVRFIGPIVSIGGFLAVIGLVVTGQVDLSSFDLGGSPTASGSGVVGVAIEPVSLTPLMEKSGESITIATFNIRGFGPEKSSDQGVLSVLASVVSRFDV